MKSGEDSQVRGDAYKTLFVARLSYDTTEKDLEREFGRFGPIERVSFTMKSSFWSFTNLKVDTNCHRHTGCKQNGNGFEAKEKEEVESRLCVCCL